MKKTIIALLLTTSLALASGCANSSNNQIQAGTQATLAKSDFEDTADITHEKNISKNAVISKDNAVSDEIVLSNDSTDVPKSFMEPSPLSLEDFMDGDQCLMRNGEEEFDKVIAHCEEGGDPTTVLGTIDPAEITNPDLQKLAESLSADYNIYPLAQQGICGGACPIDGIYLNDGQYYVPSDSFYALNKDFDNTIIDCYSAVKVNETMLELADLPDVTPTDYGYTYTIEAKGFSETFEYYEATNIAVWHMYMDLNTCDAVG